MKREREREKKRAHATTVLKERKKKLKLGRHMRALKRKTSRGSLQQQYIQRKRIEGKERKKRRKNKD